MNIGYLDTSGFTPEQLAWLRSQDPATYERSVYGINWEYPTDITGNALLIPPNSAPSTDPNRGVNFQTVALVLLALAVAYLLLKDKS